MMRNWYVLGGIVAAAVVCHGQPAWAQGSVSAAQNKLLARRAAEADCYRKLAETVYGLRLTSTTFVRDFVTESDEIRTSVDEFIKGVRLGPPRYYEDGTCEVDGEVTVAKLIRTLKEVHATHYEGNVVTSTHIESIKERIKKDVIRATGAGAPRPDLPPGLPAGVESVITPLPPSAQPLPMSVPAIWRTIPAQAKLMALKAARVDAQRKLLERIKGLRLNSTTLVRDFVTEQDEIRTHAQGMVVGSREVSRYLHSDELIAEVTMEVEVAQVLTTIKELHSAYYHGNSVTSTDIVDIKKRITRKTISATGSGVPAPRYLQQAVSAGFPMPDWIGERIAATGEGTDSEMQTAQGKLRAARAAQLDALRKIAEQIRGLKIESSTTVADFVTLHDEISAQVDAIISGALADPPIYSSDVARVKVSVPASDVWRVVHTHMKIVDRRG